jgi:hypothetical protein
MKAILEELAAGRIDAAEAARRIDALKASQSSAESPTEPTNEQLAGSEADSDAWAAATDWPQSGDASAVPEPEASPSEPGAPTEEPVRAKAVNVGGVERISVRAVGRRVRILGETSVATAARPAGPDNLWIVPAKVDGTWKVPNGELTLKQTFQMISGTLKSGNVTAPVNGKLNGEQITFTAGEGQYSGRVNGNSMEGSLKSGGKWSATRAK